jgi:signal transduction histidine kinase
MARRAVARTVIVVRALLRSVWDEPRPPGAPLRVWRDWLLVGVLVSVVVLEGALRPELPHRWVQVAIVVALVPLLLWRRTRPLLVLAVVFAGLNATAVLTGDDDGLYSAVFALVVLYALVRWGSGRELVIGLGIVLVSTAGSLVVGSTGVGDTIGGLAVVLGTVAVAAAVRFGAGARARELDQVKLVERESLARDLHDTVAHHVSVIAVRAQAGLATAPSRPEAAAEALRLIEAEARTTLAEMRGMVRLLRRDGPAELAPGPGLTEVRQLATADGDGPAVDVDLRGNLDDLPSSVSAAVYRIAQEAVTNARRHARNADRVEVRVVADDAWVHVRVSDDGDGAGRPAGGGFGLRGMAERAQLLGGSCETGPGPGRGWTVTAVLPRRGGAA